MPAPRLRIRVGGTVPLNDVYIKRSADQELPAALRAGRLSYVLAPRQMGKSSLAVQVKARLRDEGWLCSSVDLTSIGVGGDLFDWYYSLLKELCSGLGAADPGSWWQGQTQGTAVARFTSYLRDELAPRLSQPAVVFIDELDSLLLRAGADDFLACIRSLDNARAERPALARLTFCLLGAALPGDLISDEKRTPFNSGQGIWLRDFSAAELAPLEAALGGRLAEVLGWTEGHPYMTMKLVEAVLEAEEDESDEDVAALVRRLFLSGTASREVSLSYAAKYFERKAQGELVEPMLWLYGRLLRGEDVAARPQDPVQGALGLTGLVAEREGRLQVRNRILAEVFNEDWVKKQQTERLFTAPLQRWLEAGRREEHLLQGAKLAEAVAWSRGRDDVTPEEREFILAGMRLERRRTLLVVTAIVATLLVGLTGAAWQWFQARKSATIAKEQRNLAERERAVADEQRLKAEQESLRAEQAAGAEREQRNKAELLRLRAEGLAKAEMEQRRNAELAQAEAMKLREQAMQAAAQQREEADNARRERGVAEQEREAADQERDWTAEGITVQKLAEQGEGLAALMRAVGAVGPLLRKGQPVPLPLAEGLARAASVTASSRRLGAAEAAAVLSAAESPDGEQVATAGADGTIRVRSLRGGADLSVSLAGHKGQVLSVAFAARGMRLLSAGADGTVRLWDLSVGHGRPERVLALPSPVYSAAFSADGGRAILACADGYARVWDLSSGRTERTLVGHQGAVLSAALSPDGRRAVTAGTDRTARIWDLRSGQTVVVLHGHYDYVRSASFSSDPEGRRVITASDDQTARIWDSRTGATLGVFKGHGGPVRAAALSPNGKTAITASTDGTARIWSAESEQVLFILQGHRAALLSAVFSPDGASAVTTSADHSVRVWDLSAKRPQVVLEGHYMVLSAAFSPDGALVAAVNTNGTWQVWDAGTGRLRLAMRWERHDNAAPVTNLAFSPDGRFLATSTWSETQIWDALGGARLKTLDVGGRIVAFSADGAGLLMDGKDGVGLWDIRTGRRLKSSGGFRRTVLGARLQGDGIQVLYRVSNEIILDGPSRVVHLPMGAFRLSLATTGAISADGSLAAANGVLAVGDQIRRVVALWDTNRLEAPRILSGSSISAATIAFSPDGSRLATSGRLDETTRIWDAKTGRAQRVLQGGAYAAFSPDGRQVVTGGSQRAQIYRLDMAEIFSLACSTIQGALQGQKDSQELLERCAPAGGGARP